MKNNPKVVIVTPIHNGKKHTLKFLASLKNQTYKNFTTVIIDDGSTDSSAKAIREKFPEVEVLKGDGNLWWSGATNMGVEWARENSAEYILTINNDVVFQPQSIEELVKEAIKHPGTLVGSMICSIKDPNYVWYFGGHFDKSKGEILHNMGSVKDFTRPADSEWLTGMGVLVPIGAYNDAGLYDKKSFPQYYGDADFSLRAKRAGYKLRVTPKSVVLVDLTSSWLGSKFEDKSWAFIPTALFSVRSQFNIMIRLRFYLRHWNLLAFTKSYRSFFNDYFMIFVKYKIKKVLRIV